MNNIPNYPTGEILHRVANYAKGFTSFPQIPWLIGIRSKEDEVNKFDDGFYLFIDTVFLGSYSGTTNTGLKGLKSFNDYNPDGVAVLEADRIVYNSHKRGMSKGRLVYRQDKAWPYYRDNNKNDKSEEIGKVIEGEIIHAHIHDVKMGNIDEFKEFINGWSLACQVFNNGAQWHTFFEEKTKDQEYITYCLLKEW